MIDIDLHSLENTQRYQNADIYQKSAVIQARPAIPGEHLVTMIGDLEETQQTLTEGYWVITNPGGEEYAISEEKFVSRYIHLEGTTYASRGRIKAFLNHTGDDVAIVAPWGEKQFGDKDCWFCVSLDENDEITGDRYICAGIPFYDTYGRVDI